MISLPRIGDKISLYYPKVNQLDVVPEMRFLTVYVDGIRDLSRCPLSLDEFLANPLERYGRYQVTGIDGTHAGPTDNTMARITIYLDWHLPHDIKFGLVGSSGGSEPRYSFLYSNIWPNADDRRRFAKDCVRRDSHYQKHLKEFRARGVTAGVFVNPIPSATSFGEPIRLAEKAARVVRKPAKKQTKKARKAGAA